MPVERPVVVAPHLPADLQRLLQPLEALGDGRVRHAETAVLALVPCRPDAEHGPPPGQYVEGGDDLGQEAGVTVRHTGDEQAQLDVLRLAGEEAE